MSINSEYSSIKKIEEKLIIDILEKEKSEEIQNSHKSLFKSFQIYINLLGNNINKKLEKVDLELFEKDPISDFTFKMFQNIEETFDYIFSNDFFEDGKKLLQTNKIQKTTNINPKKKSSSVFKI